jgi:ADP-ribose pyrophosphatase YjhB (NUDIX family)
MTKHVDSTIVFIFNNKKNKVLMLNRVKKFGFDWGFVCGKFEENETAQECANRELFEELGLKKLNLIKFKKIKYDKDEQTYYHHYFCTTISEKTKLNFQKKEINEINWFKFDELPKNRAPDNPLEALEILN